MANPNELEAAVERLDHDPDAPPYVHEAASLIWSEISRLREAISSITRERDEARDENERLHERLEDNFAFNSNGERVAFEPGTIPDGIECRDETIRQQDERIKRLVRERDAMREAGKPFFDLAKTVTTPAPGSPPWWQESQDWTVVFSFAGCSVTLGDLRRAAALVNGEGGE